jgi:acyl-CoA thioesterase
MTSTVSMTVHFHATPEELAEVGDSYVLSEVHCRRCEGGYFDHELKLWSRSGALLATSEQMAAFRD